MVSSDLHQECQRLQWLEYNTNVCYGVKARPMLPVLDPESETVIMDIGMEVEQSTTSVGQISSQLQPETAPQTPPIFHPNPPDQDNPSSPPAGCRWIANSCAYNTFFMIMFMIYRKSSDEWRSVFRSMGPWYLFLVEQFEHLANPANFSSTERFSKCRDKLQTLLSQHDPEVFPPPGEHYTSIRQVFEIFEKSSCRNFTLSQRFICTGGCESECDVLHLPNMCTTGNWTNAVTHTGFVYRPENASIQLFIDLQIAAKIQ